MVEATKLAHLAVKVKKKLKQKETEPYEIYLLQLAVQAHAFSLLSDLEKHILKKISYRILVKLKLSTLWNYE